MRIHDNSTNNSPLGRHTVPHSIQGSGESCDLLKSKESFTKSSASAGEDLKKNIEALKRSKSGKTKEYPKSGATWSSLEMKNYMNPENEGRVKHMLLTVDYDPMDNYLDAVKTLIREMPQAKFTILTTISEGKEFIKDIKGWMKQEKVENPKRVNMVRTKNELSIWAQDSLLISGNKAIQQEREWHSGWDDAKIPQLLADANPELEFEKMEGIFIDGGNQRATMDKLYVGSDAIAFALNNMKKYPSKMYKIAGENNIPDARATKTKAIYDIIDKTIPGNSKIFDKFGQYGDESEHPSFPLDMAVTILDKVDPASGKPVVLVGDFTMAHSIIHDIYVENPEKFKQYDKMIQKNFQGCPHGPIDIMTEQLDIYEPEVQECLNDLAFAFKRGGYQVERVPYMGASEYFGTSSSEDTEKLPWISYNASSINGDKVFLPGFNIPELDNAGIEAYQKHGYEAVLVNMTGAPGVNGDEMFNALAEASGSREYPQMSREDMIKAIIDSKFPHQEIVIVGYKGEQPAFHIDMAITPLSKKDPETGKPVMVVGDPQMAIDILTDMKANDPEKYEMYQEIMMDKTDIFDPLLDSLIETVGEETEVIENFDALARGFKEQGYTVVRVPYLGSEQLEGFPWITYNNSIIDGDNVFVPNFEIPELDNPGNDAYRKFGYNPIPIDMTNITTLQGALNCITKVVEREYQA